MERDRLNTSDFFYDLPSELIAQTPTAERAASRLLVYNRNTRSITDGVFSDILSYLHAGDVLVRNTTRVIPARLLGTREDTGGHMEFLLLRRQQGDRWECLARPARRARPGQEYSVGDALRIRVLEDTDAEGASSWKCCTTASLRRYSTASDRRRCRRTSPSGWMIRSDTRPCMRANAARRPRPRRGCTLPTPCSTGCV